MVALSLTYRYPFTIREQALRTLTKFYLQSPGGERFWMMKDYFVLNKPPRELSRKYGYNKRLIAALVNQLVSLRILHNDVAKIISSIEEPLKKHPPFARKTKNGIECILCGAEFNTNVLPGTHVMNRHKAVFEKVLSDVKRYVEV